MIEFTSKLDKTKLLSKFIQFGLDSIYGTIRTFFKIFPYTTGNVVIISLHRIGDTVFTIPAILAIRNYYSKPLTIVCYNESEIIYKLKLRNLNYCTFKKEDFFFGQRLPKSDTKRKLKKLKPEIIFDLTGVSRSANLVYNIRAKEIIGINRKIFQSIYTTYSPIRRTPHSADIYLDAISGKIKIEKKSLAEHRNIVDLNNKKIIFHPFAGWKSKEWPLRKFIEVAKQLNSQFDICIIATQNKLANDLKLELSRDNIEIFECTSLEDLINKLKEGFLLVGCDSGPQHIASILEVPTYIIYAPTNPAYHKPNGETHEIYWNRTNCTPLLNEKLCFTSGGRFGCPSFECMNNLNVDVIVNGISDFIQKKIVSN